MGDFYSDTLPRQEVIKNTKEAAAKPDAIAVTDPELAWEEQIHARTPHFPVKPAAIPISAYLPSSITPFTDPDYQRKNVFWNAFANKAKEAEANHGRMASALNAFRDAENTPEAKRMQYSVSDSVTPIDGLTDKQHVPDEDGMNVDQVFDESGSVVLDESDIEALDTANKAAKRSRRHPMRVAANETDQQDANRTQALTGIIEAASMMRSSCDEFLAAEARVRVYQAVLRSEQTRAEISELQVEANAAKEGVQLVSDILSGIVHAAEGAKGAGDAIDKLGTAVATIVGHINDGEIADAHARLKRVAATIESETLRSLSLELAAKSRAIFSSGQALIRTHGSFLATYGPRRAAYQNLGEAVTAAGGGKSRRAGAAIAALPLVEHVVERAQGLRQESNLPLYTVNAGKGLALADENDVPVKRPFLLACDEIAGAQRHAESAEQKWRKRLESVFAVKERALNLTTTDEG